MSAPMRDGVYDDGVYYTLEAERERPPGATISRRAIFCVRVLYRIHIKIMATMKNYLDASGQA